MLLFSFNIASWGMPQGLLACEHAYTPLKHVPY